MAEITIYSTKSTFVNDASTSTNYGTQIYLYIGEGAGGSDQYALIEFDLTTCPVANKIKTAVLYLTVGAVTGGGATITSIQRCTASWNEGTVTWDTQPAHTGDYGAMDLTSTGDKSLDITDLVKGWKAGTIDNYGIWTLHAEPGTNYANVRSDDYATEAERPRLVIVEKVAGGLGFGNPYIF